MTRESCARSAGFPPEQLVDAAGLVGNEINGTAITDPVIPIVPGEPGATFLFSDFGVNDEGVAVGYYGDSTTSQHGFLYNTHTGAYTFVDDPAETFDNGVVVTQITGISDSGEIAGFYMDANGVASFHCLEHSRAIDLGYDADWLRGYRFRGL